MGRRIWLVGGSIGTGVLLILAFFPAVVSAHTTTSIKKIIESKSFSSLGKQKLKSFLYWEPGDFIGLLFTLFAGFLYWIFLNFHS